MSDPVLGRGSSFRQAAVRVDGFADGADLSEPLTLGSVDDWGGSTRS